jgi:hypothetical protein
VVKKKTTPPVQQHAIKITADVEDDYEDDMFPQVKKTPAVIQASPKVLAV